MLAIHPAVRLIFRSSTEILPGSPDCKRISWSTTILRMKISPSSQRFGHGQCQESYLSGLILELIYKLPYKVYFDSCTFSPFGKSSRKIKTLSQCFKLTLLLLMLRVHMFLCILHNLLNWNTGVIVVEKATNHSHIISAHDYSRQQIVIICCHRHRYEDALHIHTLRRSLGAVIYNTKPYDPINILSTFGNDKSFQQEKHLSSQTGWDEVFQLAVREHHNNHKLHTSKKVSQTSGDLVRYSSLLLRLLSDRTKSFSND